MCSVLCVNAKTLYLCVCVCVDEESVCGSLLFTASNGPSFAAFVSF